MFLELSFITMPATPDHHELPSTHALSVLQRRRALTSISTWLNGSASTTQTQKQSLVSLNIGVESRMVGLAAGRRARRVDDNALGVAHRPSEWPLKFLRRQDTVPHGVKPMRANIERSTNLSRPLRSALVMNAVRPDAIVQYPTTIFIRVRVVIRTAYRSS